MSPADYAYRELASAIVKQAADDYRKALRGRGYQGKSAEKVIKELEKFFHSKWFHILTKVDPDYLIERLKAEHEEYERKKNESNIDTSNP